MDSRRNHDPFHPSPIELALAAPASEERAGSLVLVDDVASLTEDIVPGCGDDNPYN
ncbi:hypothetical protein ACSMX9_18400 [Streptomyces sp. LE64]|uniref:hypothetical protein n=1 Tax=Streptomyces sp. LE64 TaxID=3448653 RepID=UPI0040417D03